MRTRIIIIGGTLILIVIIVFLTIWPTAKSVWTTWRTLAKTEQELKEAQNRKEVLADLAKNREEITRVVQIAEKYIPSTSDSGALILEISAIASQNNLRVEKTSIDEQKKVAQESTAEEASPKPAASVQPASAVSKINFSMELSGNFNDLSNFLKTVESSSRLIILNNVTMQQKENAQKYSINGSAFYKPKVSIVSTLENIKVSKATLETFLNLKSYAQPINLPSESGFGRTNPFEGY